jgi:serine/threonine-protein kinase RsbT
LEEVVLAVDDEAGVTAARRTARAFAASLGFHERAAERVALSVSELSTNLVRYAEHGSIVIRRLQGERGIGIEIESRDDGPGIADIGKAMEDRFSTGGGLGSGLPAVRRLMDEFEIASDSRGTYIRARAWLNDRS